MKHCKQAPPVRKTAIAAALALLTAPMLAAPTIAQQLMLEEVIVTAQKRTENVQDIAATVNVITGAAVDDFAAFNFGDLEEQTSGITLSSPNARNSSISMRGIGADPESGVAAAVDTYWNDMVVRADIAFTQLYDIARMEIIRGPQGTLQGRTSPAGAIKVVTKMPDLNEAAGYVQLTAADNDGFNGQLGYGAPLVEDKFAVRVAAVYDTNNSADVDNITTGKDDPEAKAKSARLSTLWHVSDTFNAALVYQYLDRDIDDPKAMDGIDSLGERPDLDATDNKALGKFNNFSDLEYDIASLVMNWEVAGHELTAVTGYVDSTKKSGTEIDRAHYVTNPAAPTDQSSDTSVDSIAQEIRLASSGNDFWDYMVGLYYLDQDTKTEFKANTYSQLVPMPPGIDVSTLTTGKLPVSSEEFGIFTFNTFFLTETLQLEAGLRWTYYDRSRRADIDFGGFSYFSPTIPPSFEQQIIDGIAAALPFSAVSDENESDTEDAFTGSLKLRWDWRDDTALYASYSRGYRPSGISILPGPNVVFLPNEDDILHDEETSDSVELGFKSRLMDGRATLNGAVYYQQYDGFLGFTRGVQLLNDSGDPVDLPGGIIHNGDANIWGVDLEGRILLTETWSFGGSGSYVNGEWDNASAPCNDREPGEVLGSCDIDGENVGGEPEWSLSLNSEYFYPLESTEIYIRGLYKYTGERDNTVASAGIGAVTDEFKSHNTLNLYGGWRSTDYSWDVFVWAKNVTDEDEVIFQEGPDQYDLEFSGGSYTQTNILQERTVGLTGRYNF